jgi:rubrerythrin
MCDQRETRLQPLLASMTVGEVLQTAMTFELNAARLYRTLAETVRLEVRPLVEELATEETEHHRLLRQLSQNQGMVERLKERIRTPATAQEFRAYVNLPELPADPLDDDLLEYAQDRERIAFEHYAHLADVAMPGPLRDLFRFLRDEEGKHAGRLATRWATMFSVF